MFTLVQNRDRDQDLLFPIVPVSDTIQCEYITVISSRSTDVVQAILIVLLESEISDCCTDDI